MSDASDDFDDDMPSDDPDFDYDDSLGGSDVDYDDNDNFDNYDDIRPSDSRMRACDVEHTVLTLDELQRRQREQVDQVASTLGLSAEDAMTLLLHYKWKHERLLELYVDDTEGVLRAAGIQTRDDGAPAKYATVPSKDLPAGFMCEICCDDDDGLETMAIDCGHRFCLDCYRHYLTQKIVDEGESRNITCPGDGCRLVVNDGAIRLVVDDRTYARYRTLLDRTFVQDHDRLRWCPAPNCENAVECGALSAGASRDLKTIVPSVTCSCGYSFCFGCGLPEHQPCICVLVKKWIKKCEDDSETANWISANTKECPKCMATIEKNGGCNHMTCRKCKYEFCWICIGSWAEHGTSWYNCSRYDEKSGVEARDNQAKSRASLERYLHYYNRYANHEQSAKLDKDLYVRTERKMTLLQSTSGMSWIEVQYLAQASSVLQQCRQTLKWTYAFAFYLERNNHTHLFEDNQKDLEMAVEQLSELFERPMQELAENKVLVMDKTAYVANRRLVLLEDTARGLLEGRWRYQVDVK
ncbi:uncharacterized protein V1510DRAFT_398175 [Dipodascopsis tothii]|uniref:uncharacterized protein n=1 Tax=Dipodascopsis tothii TaxID=44089 RepID=UPI0034CD784F